MATDSILNTVLWTVVEMNAAIISGCLPCLRPLLNSFLNACGYHHDKDTKNDVATMNTWKSRHTMATELADRDHFRELRDDADKWSTQKEGDSKSNDIFKCDQDNNEK